MLCYQITHGTALVFQLSQYCKGVGLKQGLS